MVGEQLVAEGFSSERESVARARRRVREALATVAPEVVDDVTLVVSELMTNAVLHARGPYDLRIVRQGRAVRVEVVDRSPEAHPVVAGTGLAEVLALDAAFSDETDVLDSQTMTGRGLLLVKSLARDWGVDARSSTKVVWAEVTGVGAVVGGSGAAVLARAAPVVTPAVRPSSATPLATSVTIPPRAATVARTPLPSEAAGNVALLAVPARLVLVSVANLDDLVREFRLSRAAAGELGTTTADLLALTAGAREPLRLAAHRAVESGHRLLNVSLPVDPAVVDVLLSLQQAIEAITAHYEDGDLLSAAPAAEVSAFRRWFFEEVVRQVGGRPPRPAPFHAVDMHDDEVLAAARHADLALAGDDDTLRPTPVDGVHHATSRQDVAAAAYAVAVRALGASSGSLCVADFTDNTVRLVWNSEYPGAVVTDWGVFSLLDDLPASEVIRTGSAMFSRTERERNARFPVFASTPVVGSEALAVVPVADFGALVLGFPSERRFGPEVRTFLDGLAGAVAESWTRLEGDPQTPA